MTETLALADAAALLAFGAVACAGVLAGLICGMALGIHYESERHHALRIRELPWHPSQGPRPYDQEDELRQPFRLIRGRE